MSVKKGTKKRGVKHMSVKKGTKGYIIKAIKKWLR